MVLINILPFFGSTASDWDFPVVPFFGSTARIEVLLDIEVGIFLANKVLSPSLRIFGLYFYIILSVDCHGC